jgi:hypothetical protein
LFDRFDGIFERLCQHASADGLEHKVSELAAEL